MVITRDQANREGQINPPSTARGGINPPPPAGNNDNAGIVEQNLLARQQVLTEREIELNQRIEALAQREREFQKCVAQNQTNAEFANIAVIQNPL